MLLLQIPAWQGEVWASTLFWQKSIWDGHDVLEGKIIIGKEVFKSSLPVLYKSTVI